MYLLSADVPLRQVVGEECVAFMLNWRENDYLTLQVPPSLVMNNPYVKVKGLFSNPSTSIHETPKFSTHVVVLLGVLC